jgi:ubiquinone/menaquinone biosynthesis C-methylase UbiE
MSGPAMLAYLVWDGLCRRPAARVPEAEGVMLDPRQNQAFDEAGTERGVLAFLYLYHAAQIAALAAPGATVLDLGCGPGQQLALAAQLAPEAQFIGLDASAPMLQAAQHKRAQHALHNLRLVEGDMTDLSAWKDGSVDALSCTTSLHHLPDAGALARCLREVARVLKPGGGLYLADFGRLRRRSTQRHFAHDWRAEQTPEFTQDYLASLAAAFSVAELSAAVQAAGLAAGRHVTPLGPFYVAFRSPARAWPPERAQRLRALHDRLGPVQRRRFEVFSRWMGFAGLATPLSWTQWQPPLPHGRRGSG